jgi:hypothetical protein
LRATAVSGEGHLASAFSILDILSARRQEIATASS